MSITGRRKVDYSAPFYASHNSRYGPPESDTYQINSRLEADRAFEKWQILLAQERYDTLRRVARDTDR